MPTYRSFQISASKVRSAGKEQDHVIQEDVVKAHNIEKTEEDARQAEIKVEKNQRIIFPQNSAFNQSCSGSLLYEPPKNDRVASIVLSGKEH